jgi:putative ABC transport system permease protein
VFEDQGAILASVVTLVVLAVTIGVALVANTLGLVVYQQRGALSALRALGFRSRSLVLAVVLQGVIVSAVGVAAGLVAAPLIAGGINDIVENLVGFAALIKLPPFVYLTGAGVGLVIGLTGAAVAGWRVAATNPIVTLRSK